MQTFLKKMVLREIFRFSSTSARVSRRLRIEKFSSEPSTNTAPPTLQYTAECRAACSVAG